MSGPVLFALIFGGFLLLVRDSNLLMISYYIIIIEWKSAFRLCLWIFSGWKSVNLHNYESLESGSLLIFLQTILFYLIIQEKTLELYSTVSILGYGLIPIVVLSAIAVFFSLK